MGTPGPVNNRATSAAFLSLSADVIYARKECCTGDKGASDWSATSIGGPVSLEIAIKLDEQCHHKSLLSLSYHADFRKVSKSRERYACGRA